MDTPKPKRLRLQRLEIQNIKVLDSFEIDLPAPSMANEPDVFVFGSKNGFGKTSFLESCGLLLLLGMYEKGRYEFKEYSDRHVDLIDILVRSGEKVAQINGRIDINLQCIDIAISLDRSGKVKISGDSRILQEIYKPPGVYSNEILNQFLFSLFGFDGEPLILPGLVFLHSYRKIQEGNPELGIMVSAERQYERSIRFFPKKWESSVNRFKLEVLRFMMAKANLFENNEHDQSQDELQQLNELVRRYTGGTIEKLRPSPDNTLGLRVTPTNGGPSFAFDGLSSGQKEIISTLFLIWFSSKNQPCIVLIDEPELHLNAEWQRDFVRQLHQLAPWNQYIIATHSQDIFESVPQERRFLLVAGKDGKA